MDGHMISLLFVQTRKFGGCLWTHITLALYVCMYRQTMVQLCTSLGVECLCNNNNNNDRGFASMVLCGKPPVALCPWVVVMLTTIRSQ